MSDGRVVINAEINDQGVSKGFTKIQNQMKTLDSSLLTTTRTTAGLSNQFMKTSGHLGGFDKNVMKTAALASTSFKGMSAETVQMQQEMKDAFSRMKTGMQNHVQDQIKVQYGYMKMAQGAKDYKGSTDEFIGEVEKLGKTQKRINDEMMKSNDMLKMSHYQTVGSMLARSGQSEKIAANYDRMGNAIYGINKPLLAVTGGLEKMAKQGNASVLALKMLGPTANMKDLADMTMMINRGLMRYQMVALAAAVTAGVLYAALFKAAKGPDPSEVYQKQADALAQYAQAVKERTSEIMETWNLFENIQLEKTSGKQLTANLQEQVNALKAWRSNLTNISKNAGEEFTQYLADMGPSAAGEVAALSKMTGPELDKYVGLWKEKMKQSKEQAVSELAGLKIETDKKVKELQATLTPLGLALEPLKAAWAQAFQPMVQAFTLVSVPIVHFLTSIGELIVRFNELHPTMALITQGFLMLIPLMTLILAPLAIGIGLINGMAAAFSAAWVFIGPLITGLGAMMGTVLLVTAVIVGVGVALYALWTKTDWFKNAVISAWESIKNGIIIAWQAIQAFIQPAIDAIVVYVMEKWSQIKAFFDENGAQILQAATNVWNFISSIIGTAIDVIWVIMQTVWPLVKGLIVSTWNAIKTVIDGALKVIMGIIKTFSSLLTGNWKGVWEGIKSILSGSLQILWGLFNLYFVSKLMGPIRAFGTGAKTLIQSIWNGIKALFDAGVTGIKNLVVAYFNMYKSIITGTMNAINSIVTTVWNAIKSGITSVLAGIRSIISATWNTISSLVSAAVNGIKSTVSSSFNSLKSVVSTAMTAVKTAIMNGWNSAKSFMSGIDLTSIGKNILQGLINGIASMSGSLVKKAKDVANSVKKTFTGLFDIHSPSRWMRDMIGENMIMGWIKGIEGMKRKILKTSEFMGELMKPDLSVITGSFTTTFADLPQLAMPSLTPPIVVGPQQNQMRPATFILEVDGREMGRTTAPHIVDEIRLRTGMR